MNLFDLVSTFFRYLFVIIIYLFILAIIRMIFLDIRLTEKRLRVSRGDCYLRLLSGRESVAYGIEDCYTLKANNVIGREEGCDICFPDRFMSQRNTLIFLEGADYYIEDLDSKNGTFVNGEPVTGDPILLYNGDKIAIGSVEFAFVVPELD